MTAGGSVGTPTGSRQVGTAPSVASWPASGATAARPRGPRRARGARGRRRCARGRRPGRGGPRPAQPRSRPRRCGPLPRGLLRVAPDLLLHTPSSSTRCTQVCATSATRRSSPSCPTCAARSRGSSPSRPIASRSRSPSARACEPSGSTSVSRRLSRTSTPGSPWSATSPRCSPATDWVPGQAPHPERTARP
ncbi:hypothetical protein NKG05_25505 [Oerskovia sp. M15]